MNWGPWMDKELVGELRKTIEVHRSELLLKPTKVQKRLSTVYPLAVNSLSNMSEPHDTWQST